MCAAIPAAFPDVPVLDVSPVLEDRAGMYRPVDTHLGDLGNVVVGEWVAAELSSLLENP
jgi:hypothetical protein